MPTFSEIVKKRGPVAAFIGLAIAGGVAINDSAKHTARSSALTVYHAQYKACIRGNSLRREINNRVAIFESEKDIVRAFLDGAAKARLANFKATHLQSDYTAFTQYSALSARMGKLHYDLSPEINCKVAVPAP